MDSNKTCSHCQAVKSENDFYYSKTLKTKDKRQTWCKPCQMKKGEPARIKRKYGIDYETYLALYKTSNGLCRICGDPEKDKRRKRLSLDHCHKTGIVRGVICSRCNLMLSNANDDPKLLLKAAKYLRDSQR